MSNIEKLLAASRGEYPITYTFVGRGPRSYVRTSLCEGPATYELEDMAPSLAAALVEARKALANLEYWFDTDDEILADMGAYELADHERQIAAIRAALATIDAVGGER